MTRRIKDISASYRRIYRKTYVVLSIVMCLVIIGTLLVTVSWLPPYGAEDSPTVNEVSERYTSQGLAETGATNIVAGMILDYRAFDTLGESFVLFTALCSVLIVLEGRDSTHSLTRDTYDTAEDGILRSTMRIVIPMIMLFGVYILLNGHLSPGGGFSGGAVLGGGLMLLSLAFGHRTAARFLPARRIRAVTCCALGFYCLAKSYSFFTGANRLPSVITTGTPGAIFSAGLILPLDIAVGCVVACTMYSFYCLFEKGGLD